MDVSQLLRRYPVTGTTSLLAIAASLAWWSGRSIEPFTMSYGVWSGQFWRPLTCTFPHVNLMHLAFDLYWLWRFGSRIEGVYGSLRTLALYLFLAVGSSLAEYDFGGVGVGLSGVGYGLFGFLWMLSSRDLRFRSLVDQQTVGLFVAWFVLCIVLTVKEIMPVGNVAHGAGMLLGLLAGWITARRYGGKLWLWAAAGMTILALLVAAGTVARPYVNFTETAGMEFGQRGRDALGDHRYEDAVKYFRLAIERYGDWSYWHNLGIAYQSLNRWKDAAEAYQAALKLNHTDKGLEEALDYAKQKAAE